jgi:hypothetical protein
VINNRDRGRRRLAVRLLVAGPLASFLGGVLFVTATLISRPVPAFAQTPVPADADVSLIARNSFPSVFENERSTDSIFNRTDCEWATDAEAGAVIGPSVVHWGNERSVCGFYAPGGEFVVYIYATWESKREVECRFGLLLAAGQGGCLDLNRWNALTATIFVDEHLVVVSARSMVDRHKLLGFANMVSARMKGKLGDIDQLATRR